MAVHGKENGQNKQNQQLQANQIESNHTYNVTVDQEDSHSGISMLSDVVCLLNLVLLHLLTSYLCLKNVVSEVYF